MPHELQAFDLQLWQDNREWGLSGEAQQAANAKSPGAAGEHALDTEFDPRAYAVTVLFEKAVPAFAVLEEQLCRTGNIHAAVSVYN
jgi:hypothetical protein